MTLFKHLDLKKKVRNTVVSIFQVEKPEKTAFKILSRFKH